MTITDKNDTITLNKSELKDLIYKILDERKDNQKSKAVTFEASSTEDYEAVFQDGKEKSEERRYSHERYDRRMDLLERVIRLEEGQHRIESNMNTRFEAMQTQINIRFDNVNKRFDNVNKRFDDVNKHFDDMNKRFNMFFWIITSGFTFLSLLIVLLKLFA